MARFKVDFNGVMDRLEELERENHRLQAENAAMRPIVEAVAEAHDNDGICPVLCSLTFYDSAEPDADYPRHDEPCVGEQARAFLASGQAAASE